MNKLNNDKVFNLNTYKIRKITKDSVADSNAFFDKNTDLL